MNDVYHMRTSLSLPLDAETLVFNAAETNLTYGRFEVSATAPQGSTEAIVEVEVFYTSPEAFNNVTMCGIHNPTGLEGDTWGLGIFVSELPRMRERPWRLCLALQGSRGDAETRPLRVHIHLRLPAPGRAPAQLGRLKTDLPHFSQTLHNLTATAFLEELSLHGSHGPVFSEVRAQYASGSRVVLTGSMSKLVYYQQAYPDIGNKCLHWRHIYRNLPRGFTVDL